MWRCRTAAAGPPYNEESKSQFVSSHIYDDSSSLDGRVNKVDDVVR